MSEHSGASRRPWLVGGVAVSVVVVLLAAGALWLWISGHEASRTQTQRQTYERDVTRVDFDVDSGSVTVVAGETGRVSVTRRLKWAAGRKPTSTERWSGSTLRLSTACPRGDRFLRPDDCELHYVVAVPPEVALGMRLAAGDADVRGVRGPVRVYTSAGTVRLSGTRGDVSVRTDAGDVRGRELRSRVVELDSDAGDVEASFVESPSDVRAHTDAGSVAVAVPRAGRDVTYQVVAETESGTRRVDLPQDDDATRTIRASTEAGDVTVGFAG